MWYPSVQFICKISSPNEADKVWKSVNVSNFVTPPPGLDKRSSKADEFSVTLKPQPGTDFPEVYLITANLGPDLQLALEIKRPASIPGWKIGSGPKAGFSYLGNDPNKADGYVIHRFWPRFVASGTIIRDGQALSLTGHGMFVHAIQSMRPNLIAVKWNFVDFQSNELGGVSAIMMEFTTTDTYGKKGAGSGFASVNIGSVVIGDKLAAVTAQSSISPQGTVVSKATHLSPEHDPDTGYDKPNQVLFEWQGPSIAAGASGTVTAKLEQDLGTVEKPIGLIEKVDVLAEIPYALKMVVNYVAGTKPYIYQVIYFLFRRGSLLTPLQWMNPAKLSLTGPEELAPGLSKGVEVQGLLYSEATFIS